MPPPIIHSFILCTSAIDNGAHGFDIRNASQIFTAISLPGEVPLDAYLTISNIHKKQAIYVTFADASTEHVGLTSNTLTIMADNPTWTSAWAFHFPQAFFPKSGEYIARVMSEHHEQLCQAKFQVCVASSNPQPKT